MGRVTKSEFIRRGQKKHGNKFDYSRVVYVGKDVHVEIICKEHGPFWQTPHNHYRYIGCSECSSKDVRKSTDQFIDEAKQTHGNRYDYSQVKYINSQTKVGIICREHGLFYQNPNKHLQGRGCYRCAGRTKDSGSNIAGKRFNRLTAVKKNGVDKYGNAIWECLCTCGNTTTLRASSLVKGRTKSCGCLAKEMATVTHGTHRMSYSSEYSTWQNMIQRCHNPNDYQYHHYGERGIQVCEQWRNSFEIFISDMGPRPTPEHTIDRIDNDSDYSPENCQWASPTVQQSNKRTSVIIEYNGVSLSASQWARKIGVHRNTIYQRLKKWDDVEKILSPK